MLQNKEKNIFNFININNVSRKQSFCKATMILNYKKSFVCKTQKIYWLYEQQAVSDKFALVLDRCLNNRLNGRKRGFRC
jgi:hypothetical protein